MSSIKTIWSSLEIIWSPMFLGYEYRFLGVENEKVFQRWFWAIYYDDADDDDVWGSWWKLKTSPKWDS